MQCDTDNEWYGVLNLIEEYTKKDTITWTVDFYKNPFTCVYSGTFKNNKHWINFTLSEQRILLTSDMCAPLNITNFTNSVYFINELTEKINKQNLIKLRRELTYLFS